MRLTRNIPSYRQARNLQKEIVNWDLPEGAAIPVEIVGDSELVVNWINGTVSCMSPMHSQTVAETMKALRTAWLDRYTSLRQTHAVWCRHLYREFKREADQMATKAVQTTSSDCA